VILLTVFITFETVLCDTVKCPWSDCFIYNTLKLTILHYITHTGCANKKALTKNLYFHHYSKIINETYRFHSGGFRTYMQQILLRYLVWFEHALSINAFLCKNTSTLVRIYNLCLSVIRILLQCLVPCLKHNVNKIENVQWKFTKKDGKAYQIYYILKDWLFSN